VLFRSQKDDLVLSSRVRLARNLKDIPFPHKLDEAKGKEVIKLVEDAFYTSTTMKDNYITKCLWDSDNINNRFYFEKHLISPKLLTNSSKSAFIIDNDETVSLMINEEDHIRLQCINGGLNLDDAYDMADKLDNLLEENLDYAFDEKLGYLTTCPTNLGTGLRASVMIHLPALTLNNEIEEILNALSQVGMTIRGLYGEGSKAFGNIYQISNQITLGLSEEDILNNLKAVVNQIINQEKLSRERSLKNHKNEIEDKIFRALGILSSAVLMSTSECLSLLSNVRFGVETGLITDVDKSILNALLVETQPAALQSINNVKLSEKDRDFNRAKLIREKLGR
jgi:protein arginine kinase